MKNLNPKNSHPFVLDQLINNEVSSDEELVEHFMHEMGVSEEQARAWVAERGYYGGIDYVRDCLANGQEYRAAREAKREREERALAKLAANG